MPDVVGEEGGEAAGDAEGVGEGNGEDGERAGLGQGGMRGTACYELDTGGGGVSWENGIPRVVEVDCVVRADGERGGL